MTEPNKVSGKLKTENQQQIARHIFQDKINMLYDQLPIGMITQILFSCLLVMGLFPYVHSHEISFWLLYMIIISITWIGVWSLYRLHKNSLGCYSWFIIYMFFVLLAGLGWGMAAYNLIPSQHLLIQSFTIILLLGVLAGSVPFFAPSLIVYTLFLIPAFLPLLYWFFVKESLYSLLGYCALIYAAILFFSCYYFNKFLDSALKLRYKNFNLDILNQFLEKRVHERTFQLEQSLALTRSTLESTADGILVVNLNGQIEYYNQKLIDLWEINKPEESLVSIQHFYSDSLQSLKDPEAFLALIQQQNQYPEIENSAEIVLLNGRIFELHLKPHHIGSQLAGQVWSFGDITQRKQLEKQLSFQANHDLLTGLPGRKLLYDRILQGIRFAKRHHRKLIILFIDLDNFKLINDTLGHTSGDRFLELIAKRLTQSARESDTVSRFGGDEFVILFDTDDYENAIPLCKRVLAALTKPIQLAHREIVATASIGVSFYPRDGQDPEALLKNADLAMYEAKNLGRNNFKIFDDSIPTQAKKTLELQMELRNALAHNEFFIVYQPTINLASQQITGAEALIRWQHPSKGLISPQEFINIAEDCGLIIPIGEWVFQQVCLQSKIWQQQLYKPIRIAVNVSGVQIGREDFIKRMKRIIHHSEVDPRTLEVELTESIIMDKSRDNLRVFRELNQLGIHLTIDDFGTGYSNLSYLCDFPITKLKIAQNFIQGCPENSNHMSITKAIIAMGHGLKMQVLAEGIETPAQLEFLKQAGCDEGQGYYFNQPLLAEEFVSFMIKNRKIG